MATRYVNSKTVVLKIGGSFLLTDAGPDVGQLKEMADTVHSLVKEGFRVIVVVGGGLTARHYIEAASSLNSSKGVMDHLGILVSRLNARVFIEALRDEDVVVSEPAETLQEVRVGIQNKSVVVLGGLQPGQSTTAVSALCAEYCSASKVIYGTDVDGVYTADPNKDPNATKLETISYDALKTLIVTTANSLPGQYRIMDGVALTILERSKIPAEILLGNKKNIMASIVDNERVGTIVGEL
eukprot:TRINITY_DN3170_c0_g1_i1.p1 TRINITY_DN3170_c0_g1~~TRINITY_DN3170_c0_g1_i1.p1  ORF type:complete len:240 (+),score=54.48 TRINITY_DN3170_c0_g1_i1:622-1341(+)